MVLVRNFCPWEFVCQYAVVGCGCTLGGGDGAGTDDGLCRGEAVGIGAGLVIIGG